MPENLRLPGSPDQYPTGVLSFHPLELPAEGAAEPTTIDTALRGLPFSPTCLLGSDRTPPLVWLLAVRAFPAARQLCFRSDSGQWWDLETNRPWPADEATATVQPDAAARPERKAATPPAAESRTGDIGSLEDKVLISRAFRMAAWGLDKPENRRQLEAIEEEAWNRAQRNPRLPDIVRQARRNGERAWALEKELRNRLDRQGDEGAEDWITAQNPNDYVRRHLEITLKKWRDYRQKRRQRHAGQRQYQSSLEPVALVDGHHPNSLRHLRPASAWQILIDETGLHFDERADALNGTDSQLGRLVALAIPKGVKLPTQNGGFHATEATAADVDRMLETLIRNPVGIFGFTVQDPVTHSNRWIGHVQQLVRWTLLQLPMPPGEPCRVEVLIEQNRGYQTQDNLHPLAEILEGELQRLDPQRFAGLRLSLKFMDKRHPLNGYVDAVAFTWGSPAAESCHRLKQSRLAGHCLLRPSDEAMERLYLALDGQYRLPPADWYELCSGASQEPQGGLLARFLDQLGERLRERPEIWRGYLGEAHQRQRLKHFRLAALGQALDWLERWAPAGQVLPAILRLPLESARLAAENHRGQINAQRIQTCLQLAAQMREEAPAEACEAILRLAVATTNNFEFAALRPAIEHWLAEPVAVPGLLNHAKLRSTLGQLRAFTGESAAALAHFDQALTCIERLSDPQQATREAAQTRSYQLIARMDTPGADPRQLLDSLAEHLGVLLDKHDPESISRSLAHSGQAMRHAHHLWLRALARFPEQTQAARAAYLEQALQWQEGDDHPWPLIDSYRGWLLRDAGQPERAAERLRDAIASCADADNGPTLQWMAEVLRTLARSLGLAGIEAPSATEREHLRQCLPQAPHVALEDFANASPLTPAQIHAALRQCLPFNFH
ncbi:hypothetical protein [Azotobacter vinelandii]|uniref:hypothetical protein n=1 Tax=Azotobacter vinelandii TaxID=354 RepID=UPI002665FFD5|nr:hypothetical protein [Azotobacter vinelandii]WKN24014.1 hypothetical protein AVAEIV_002152 [Azotobacter vinelandii]